MPESINHKIIKEEKPKYNVQFKDDKGYPWISFEVSKSYPSVKSFLGKKNKKDLYFGPFPSSISVKNPMFGVDLYSGARAGFTAFFSGVAFSS